MGLFLEAFETLRDLGLNDRKVLAELQDKCENISIKWNREQLRKLNSKQLAKIGITVDDVIKLEQINAVFQVVYNKHFHPRSSSGWGWGKEKPHEGNKETVPVPAWLKRSNEKKAEEIILFFI